MKVKTSELTGIALNWAVAKAIGEYKPVAVPSYSTDWAQGGPIIEREDCWPSRYYGAAQSRGKVYQASAYNGSSAYAQGPTPLIAAMRCYVASKLGDTVDIPED